MPVCGTTPFIFSLEGMRGPKNPEAGKLEGASPLPKLRVKEVLMQGFTEPDFDPNLSNYLAWVSETSATIRGQDNRG